LNNFKSIAIWMVVALVLMTVFNQFNTHQQQTAQVQLDYSQFLDEVNQGHITKVIIEGRTLKATTAEGKRITSYAPSDLWMVSDLLKNGVSIEAKPEEEPSFLMNIFVSWFPMILLIGVWIFFMRQMQGGGKGGAFSFGKSRARMMDENKERFTFADVAGCDEAKEEVSELVDFLRDPSKFQNLGGRIPRGVLLVGNPGTGKTLLAKAISGEAKVPFFSISGSDFVEMFVGVGAARVRDLFGQAAEHAPSIIFIDELDALGKARGVNILASHDEREQTLNQLLAEMDGFDPNKGVIMMAATNRPEILDPALLRPGRFDRQVLVDRPDVRGREKILLLHAKKIKLSPAVDLGVVAAKTPGFVGADLANIVNEAALLAARQGKDAVEIADFDEAIERVVAGLQKKSRVMNPQEKKTVAYHESGHALVAELVPGADPVAKISIIPRGIAALGYTQQLPTEDRYLMTRSELLGRIYVLLGGRVAEEMVFGDISTGAQNDLQRATEIARTMVTQFGMSEKLGLVALEGPRTPLFLPIPMQSAKEYSDETARVIDAEVKQILEQAHDKVKEILASHRPALEELASLLLKKEVVERPELQAILKVRSIDRAKERKKAPEVKESEQVQTS